MSQPKPLKQRLRRFPDHDMEEYQRRISAGGRLALAAQRLLEACAICRLVGVIAIANTCREHRELKATLEAWRNPESMRVEWRDEDTPLYEPEMAR